jgi:pyruvate dehydrogenase E2 component (dihydrolipoamide acetyltransferase)
MVPIGEVLITIGEEADWKTKDQKKDSGTVVGTLEEAEAPSEADKEILATPKVRKMADEMKIDITKVQGTGPEGAITEKDIVHTAHEQKPGARREDDAYGAVIKIPLRGLRKTIAKNMPKFQQAAAHVTHMDEADITELAIIKEKEESAFREKGKKLTYLPFIIKAVVVGLKEFPYLNSSMEEETGDIIIKKYYHIGISVNTKDGLIVPVIRDADQKNIIRLAENIEELAVRGRKRRLDIKELKGSTFTITNIGSYGGNYATPIINYPEAAILATGRIKEMPRVVDGEIQIRKVLPLSLAFDHRILDGGMAANFINTVIRHLEDPGLLLLELK